MKIEVLIYIYLVICFAMILFNLISAYLFRKSDIKVIRTSGQLAGIVMKEIDDIRRGEAVDEGHKKYLIKSMRKSRNLLAFDNVLETIRDDSPKLLAEYLRQLESVFEKLIAYHTNNEKIELAYVLHIIGKYEASDLKEESRLKREILKHVVEPSLYCRENAMEAVYASGNVEAVIEALDIVDRSEVFHHGKLISDGMLKFTGDKELLWERLWQMYPGCTVEMKVSLLNYFRFAGYEDNSRILEILFDKREDDEVRFSCIRFFGKTHYEGAYEQLLYLADRNNGLRWEYKAIASTALGIYPGTRTKERLVDNLYSRDWYIRLNAAKSLERLGYTYLDMIDIIEGPDRYASEILQYQFDVRNSREGRKL